MSNTKNLGRDLCIKGIEATLIVASHEKFILVYNSFHQFDNPIYTVKEYLDDVLDTLTPIEAYSLAASGQFKQEHGFCRCVDGVVKSTYTPQALVDLKDFSKEIYYRLNGDHDIINGYLKLIL